MGLAARLGMALPADGPGWASLAAACAALLVAGALGSKLRRVPRWAWAGGWALVAAALSLAYVHHYLRGGPRIIDATSYWLEARAMAHGLLAWPLDVPTASFRGRFLLLSGQPEAPSLGVIFPPGYPAVLALAFLARAPLLLGPAIAALVVIATEALAREATGRDDVARVAAVVSALCACLRYHTADTMSHGLAALALAGALVLGFRARSMGGGARRDACWAACGWCAAWLVATRPVSGLALAACGAVLLGLGAKGGRARALGAVAAGTLLPLALLAVHQRAVTGHWLASSHALYYLASDGPAGCFRYGFGRGIGCLVEHSPYVQSVLPEGFGAKAAAVTTLRRLHLHLSDVANIEPLALLAPLGAWLWKKDGGVLAVAAVPPVLWLAYVPFYFDGSYPGGGARLLADALPLEHVLVAAAVCSWAATFRDPARGFGWAIGATAAAMMLGFSIRASHEHARLRERDGGRPLFERSALGAALGPSPRGLLFVGSDHAFNLAHDPSIRRAADGLVVARERGDERDRQLWERLGRPAAWRYVLAPWTGPTAPARIDPWRPPAREPGPARFEAEAEWPPLAQSGGYAIPTYLAPGSCVSAGAGLGLVRTGDAPVCVEIEVPLAAAGPRLVGAQFVVDGPFEATATLVEGSRQTGLEVPAGVAPARIAGAKRSELDGRWCVPLGAVRSDGRSGAAVLRVCSREKWLAVDRVDVVATVPATH